MGKVLFLRLLCGVLAVLGVSLVNADDPYRYYTWTVTYGTISPLGEPQQVILINGQFPGPQLDVVTNDNIILNLVNKLDQPFLLTWNGIKQRKNSWQDGVLGTNCPIPPNSNYTYKFQTKDQIGTFTYFPSTLFHRAAGGYGAINVYERPRIPIPFSIPDGDFSLLIGDWYKTNHKALQASLDSGKPLAFPDGVLINGQTHTSFSADQGKTYMFRISNMGLSTSLNFRIQGHMMKLVEVEGSHTIQNIYDSLDVHVGQSVAVLVTLNFHFFFFVFAFLFFAAIKFRGEEWTTSACLFSLSYKDWKLSSPSPFFLSLIRLLSILNSALGRVFSGTRGILVRE